MGEVIWQDGVPVSVHYNDPYYSLEDGLAETRFVFLGGNDLPERFVPGFSVAELGFGTGLTVLALWEAWDMSGVAGALRFTSFEAHPLTATEMEAALHAFPEFGARAAILRDAWAKSHGPTRRLSLQGLDLEVLIGDARERLPGWDGQADAWCLDGFSPAKNPELWEPELLRQVATHSKNGATLATYSAAGHIRRSLTKAGFAVERVEGFGRKRHMTRGKLHAAYTE